MERLLRGSPQRAAVVVAPGLLALLAFGVVMLATLLRPPWVAGGAIVVVALLPELARRCRWRWLRIATVVPLAVVVPVLGLLGFDVLWAWSRAGHPGPGVGLLIAGAVVGLMAYVYLRWLGEPPPRHPLRWSLFASLSAVVLYLVTSHGRSAAGPYVVAVCVGGATEIYLRTTPVPAVRHPLMWALVLAVSALLVAPLLVEAIVAKRLDVELLAGEAAAVLILGVYVLGGSRRAVRRPVHLVGGMLVLLALPLLARGFAGIAGVAHSAALPRPLPAPLAAAPLPAFAVEHLPILRFDRDERLHTPLDVDSLLASGLVELCPSGQGPLAACRRLHAAADLRNGVGHLRFDTQQVDRAPLPTTLYVHSVPDRLRPGDTDLDYWWYLPDNPADSARGAMCGAGLVIPEITCFDHQSDWEGVTVEVRSSSGALVAVRYAQHAFVVQMTKQVLSAAWSRPEMRAYVAGPDVTRRPLVFVARGTHAAYPVPCGTETCGGKDFADNEHDGALPWPAGVRCSRPACLRAFPETAGRQPAGWNAFDGQWGSAVCVSDRVHLCEQSDAPRAPGTQDRFKQPWCYQYVADAVDRPRKLPHPLAGCS